MKQHKYSFIYIILCGLNLTGCDKYLDVQPKGKTTLTTVTNFDQWLNDPSLNNGFGAPTGTAGYLGDNVDVPTITNPPIQPAELLYTWAPQFSSDLNIAPLFWSEHYTKINQYNTVLLGIDDATGGTNAQKRSLKAEALLGRALEYFYLVNLYGKPYDSTTAATDLAVPFVTSNEVVQIVPPRTTVAALTSQIIEDINTAIPDLPLDNSSNRLRASRAAGYSILARIYLYARNYYDARKNAELALENTRAVMLDFNEAAPSSPLLSIRGDVIYGRMVLGYITPTLDFMRSFATNDLRVRALYRSTDSYTYTTRGATIYIPQLVTLNYQYMNTGTSVQEMKLIIAECAARSNELTVALQQLDELRKNRIAKATYAAFQSTNQEEVFQEVMKERNHELPFMGLRWFDMRRLDKENRMGPVNRYNAQGAVVATLQPHSERYTLQIPVQVLVYNPDMQQNP